MPIIRNFAEAQDALRPLYENARLLYNMDTMRQLMVALGNPQNQLRVIHVAGTSGKTSTAYYCAELLRAQDLQVGLTVSPHVDTVNERLQINGQPLPEAEYCGLLGEFLDIVSAAGIKASYFETLTAMAYWQFAARQVDYAVIEVGMGGEMDATNVVDRADKVCVITDIGLDHTEILGNTLAEIASKKAGIIQPHNQVFMYQQGQDVMAVVQATVERQEAELHSLAASAALDDVRLPLFQQRNLGLAWRVIDFVNQRDGRLVLPVKIIEQTAKLRIPARLERFQIGDKTVIVDGSHNQQKLETLLQSVRQLYPDEPLAAVCAFVQSNDRRWQEGLNVLLPAARRLIFTSFHSEKDYPKSSVDPVEIMKYCEKQGSPDCEIIHEPSLAYQTLLRRPEKVLLITGSFYLLNHIRPLIKEQE